MLYAYCDESKGVSVLRARTIFTALVLLAASSACGGGGGAPKGGGGQAEPVPPPEVAFTIADQGVTEVPDDVRAGPNNLSVTNEGKDKHFPALVRINDDSSRQEVGIALAKEDFRTFFLSSAIAGSIVGTTEGNVRPGETATTTVELIEGEYLLVDPEAKRFEPGFFRVGPAQDDEVESPESDYEIAVGEYYIELPKEIAVGPHTFSLTNEGEQDHEVLVFEKGSEKESAYALAPVPGATAWVTFDLEAGKYVVACHFPDVKKGKIGEPHSKLGMRTTITVK